MTENSIILIVMGKIIYSKNKHIIILLAAILICCRTNTAGNKNSNALSFSITGRWQVFKIVHGNAVVQKTPDEANVSFDFKRNLTFEATYTMNDDVVEKFDGTYTVLPDSTLHTYKLREGGHDEFKVIQAIKDTLQLVDTKKSRDTMHLVKAN